MTLALTAISVILSMALGVWLVGRPVDALSKKARRIGEGDLAGPVHLDSNDELALLAGEVNAMCDHLREAHERIERETAARIQTLEQLRHADRLMTVGKLASGVAHELGTPLNVVSARASMIASGKTNADETREYAQVIADASRRMTNIIKQLLTFARRTPATKAPCNLEKTARDTLDLLRPLAAKKHVELRLESDANVRSSVDAGGIQQVLTNLIVNAVQAMPQGGAVDVELGREQAKAPGSTTPTSYVRIRVRDHGEGIPRTPRGRREAAHRRAHRRQPRDAARSRDHRARRRRRIVHLHHGRERHGQGGRRPRASPPQPLVRWPVRRRQLRSDARGAPRE